MANKAIKYRVYPTTKQSIMFAKTFGCCRKVYNLMHAQWIFTKQSKRGEKFRPYLKGNGRKLKRQLQEVV